ncbi:MAG: TlpA disulfide reductase family protein [Acidobacteriota bacterium]|jgi:thiol-disulfide isomerase/thioredoxin
MRAFRCRGAARHGVPATLLAALVLGTPLPGMAAGPYVEGSHLTFTLPDLEGMRVYDDDARFQGKVVLVDLWGSWCPPCLTEIPTLVEMGHRYRDSGLVVVGIGFERMDAVMKRRAIMRSTRDRYGIDYLLLDGGQVRDVAAALPTIRNISGLPVQVLIGRDGTVVETWASAGHSKRWERKLEARIRKALGLDRPGEDGKAKEPQPPPRR